MKLFAPTSLFFAIPIFSSLLLLTGTASNCSAASVTIPAGTQVLLSLNDELTSGVQAAGTPVDYVVDIDVCAPDGTVLIPAGSKATGTVTQSDAKGLIGTNGTIKISCNSVLAADGTKISFANTDVMASGGGMIFAPPLVLLFAKGHDVYLHQGMPFVMNTASDTKINGGPAGALATTQVQLLERGRNVKPYTTTVTSFTPTSVMISTPKGDKVLKLTAVSKILPGNASAITTSN